MGGKICCFCLLLFLQTPSWPLPVWDLLCCSKKNPQKTQTPTKNLCLVPPAEFAPFVSKTRLATGAVWVVEDDFVAVNYCRAGGQQPLSEASFFGACEDLWAAPASAECADVCWASSLRCRWKHLSLRCSSITEIHSLGSLKWSKCWVVFCLFV